jgi:ketosteroid isomerase-like protein
LPIYVPEEHKGEYMVTDADKKAIAQQFLAGLRSRDWSLLRSIMTEDIVWSLPGTSLISGEASGVDAVIARAQRIVSYGLTFTLEHILIGQHGIALSLHNTAKNRNEILDEHLATVCIFRDEKICGIDTYLSDVEMVNAFFV